VNPRSTSSVVTYGAIVFLASALTLGATSFGSAIDSQKNGKSGAEDQRSNTKSNRPQGLPSPPTNLRARPDNAQVSLTWTDSSGATSYTVLRSTIDGGPYTSSFADITKTSYIDTTVINGTTYYYVVQAVNGRGVSENSNQANAEPMAPPTDLKTRSDNAQVSLTWTASSGATSYTVLRSTTDGGPYTSSFADITKTSYIDTTVINGTTYYYVVQAVHGRVVSGNSNQANAMPSVESLVPELKQRIETLRLVAVIAVGAAITSLIFTVLIFLDRKRRVRDSYYEINSKVANLRTELASLRSDLTGTRQVLQGRLDAFRREFVTAESFDSIRRAIERLQSERPFAMTNYRATGPHPQFPDPDPRGQQPPVQVSPTIFATPPPAPVIRQYADLPERDGFRDSSLKSKEDFYTLYTLTIQGSDSAIVEIYNASQRFDAAIKAPEQYLSPVCEYDSNPPSSAKTIRLLSPGKASREGQIWRVTQKLKIEFL
jgi:hypothetical protein